MSLSNVAFKNYKYGPAKGKSFGFYLGRVIAGLKRNNLENALEKRRLT